MVTSPQSPHQTMPRFSVANEKMYHGDARNMLEDDMDDLSDMSDSSSSSAEDESELDDAFGEVQAALGGLNRLAIKIRSSKHRSVPIKALSLKIIDIDSGHDLFSSYAEHDYRHVEEFLR